MESYDTHEETRRKQIKQKLKFQKYYDTFAAIFAFLGWIWEYSQYDRYYEQIAEVTVIDGESVIDLKPEREETYMMILRICVTLSTAALLLCIYARYRTEIDIKLLVENYKSKMSEKTDSLTAKDKMKIRIYTQMGCEMAYLAVHSLPGVNKNMQIDQQGHYLEYSLDMILFVIMQGRVYLIFRLVKHYTRWMSDDAKEICYSQGTPANMTFALKAILKDMPALLVTFCIFLLMVLGGFSMRVFERPYMHVSGLNWDNYFNSIWVTFAIITTVGYGDMFPMSHVGRMMGVFTCIAGQFLVSLMITAIASFMAFSAPQDRAFNRIKDAVQREQLEIYAKNLVVYGYKHYKELKKSPNNPSNKYYSKFMSNLLLIKELKRFMEIEEANTPFELLAEKIKAHVEQKKFEVIRAMRTNKKLYDKVVIMENQMKASETILEYLKYQGIKIHEALENAARECSGGRSFNGILNNSRALQCFETLSTLDPPPQLKPFDYDLSVLGKPLHPHQVLTEQQQLQLYYRVERSKTIISPELILLLQDSRLPHFALREKRIFATNREALNSLKNYLIIRAYGNNPRGHYLNGTQLVDAILAGKYLTLTDNMLNDPNIERDEGNAPIGETFILDGENNKEVGSPSKRLLRTLSKLEEHQDGSDALNSPGELRKKLSLKQIKPELDLKRKVRFTGVSKGSIPSIPEGLTSMKDVTPATQKSAHTLLLPNEEMDEILEEEEVGENNDFFDSTLEHDRAEGRVPQWKNEFMNVEPLFRVDMDELRRLPDMASIPVDQENIWARSAPRRTIRSPQKTVKQSESSQKSISTSGVTSLDKLDRARPVGQGEGGVTSLDKLDRFRTAASKVQNPVIESPTLQGLNGEKWSLDDITQKMGSRNLENPTQMTLKPKEIPQENPFSRLVQDVVKNQKHSYSGLPTNYEQMLAQLNSTAPSYPQPEHPRDLSTSKRGSSFLGAGSDLSYGGDSSDLLDDDIIKQFKKALDKSDIHKHQKYGSNNFGFDKKDPYKIMTPSVGTGRTFQDFLEDSNLERVNQQFNDSWNTLIRDQETMPTRQELDWRNKGLQTVQGSESKDARRDRDRGYNYTGNPNLEWFGQLDISSPSDPNAYYSDKSILRISKGDSSQKGDRTLKANRSFLELDTPGEKSYYPNTGHTFWSGY